MIALLGLIGIAISALVIMDTETADDFDGYDSGEGTLDTSGGAGTIVPLSEIVYADELDDTISISDVGGPPVFAGAGDDMVTGGASDDYIDGEDGDDIISGGAGDDDLHGGRDQDIVNGGDGDDTISGHVGDDTLRGEGGNDALQGGDGDDTLDGGDGDDTLQGYLGNDTIITGNGADVAYGGAGDDMLDGRDDGAMDYLNGGAGQDRLIGGTADHMMGGTGADVFAMQQDAGTFVGDFDADDDQIEVLYEGDIPPVITTQSSPEGLNLLADGEVITTLANVESLDLSRVTLVAA